MVILTYLTVFEVGRLAEFDNDALKKIISNHICHRNLRIFARAMETLQKRRQKFVNNDVIDLKIISNM